MRACIDITGEKEEVGRGKCKESIRNESSSDCLDDCLLDFRFFFAFFFLLPSRLPGAFLFFLAEA